MVKISPETRAVLTNNVVSRIQKDFPPSFQLRRLKRGKELVGGDIAIGILASNLVLLSRRRGSNVGSIHSNSSVLDGSIAWIDVL